jgi:hypothetical protein
LTSGFFFGLASAFRPSIFCDRRRYREVAARRHFPRHFGRFVTHFRFFYQIRRGADAIANTTVARDFKNCLRKFVLRLASGFPFFAGIVTAILFSPGEKPTAEWALKKS